MEGSRAPVKETIEFARIVAFTDGVFAIAITILVLGIDVPEELPGPDLHDFLVEAWPQLFAYFLSFAVIGRHWVSHHRDVRDAAQLRSAPDGAQPRRTSRWSC